MNGKGLTGRALGEAVIDHVLTFPEQHDQESVACGSTACLAGWTIALHHGLSATSFHSDGYFKLKVQPTVGWRESDVEAARLLGIRDLGRFDSEVFGEPNRDRAIANFKHLLDESA